MTIGSFNSALVDANQKFAAAKTAYHARYEDYHSHFEQFGKFKIEAEKHLTVLRLLLGSLAHLYLERSCKSFRTKGLYESCCAQRRYRGLWHIGISRSFCAKRVSTQLKI